MINIGTLASIIELGIATMSVQYMIKTENLLQFSLKCQPIHPGIHKDSAIGPQTLGCLPYQGHSQDFIGYKLNFRLKLMALEHLSQAPQFLGPFPSQSSIA